MCHSSVYLSTILPGLLHSSLWLVCTLKLNSILTLSFSCILSWKSISIAHHPQNNQTNSIMSPLAVLLLCKHLTFSNHMADRLLSFSKNQHKGETCCQLCAICSKSLVLYHYEHSLSLLPLGSCFSQFQVSWHLTSSVFLINCE